MLDQIVRTQPAAQILAGNHRLDLVSRELVSQLVVHDLVDRQASAQGLRVNQEQLEQLMREDKLSQPVSANGSVPPTVLVQQLAAGARDHREVYTDQLLLQQLGRKAFNQVGISFDFTTVSVGDMSAGAPSPRAQALSKAEQLAAGPDAEAKIIRADAAAGVGQMNQYLAAQNNDLPAAAALFGAPVGSIIALQPDPQSSSWLVAVIKDRKENADASGDQTPQIDQDYLADLGRHMLLPTFAEAGIKISPRYGVWDPVAMGLAPNEAETTGVVLKLKEAAKS
jgi:hypothetical protein